MEFEFRYAPSIFGEIMGLGLGKFQQSNSYRFGFRCTSLIFRGMSALDLVNFIDGTVFQTFFLFPCRYCAEFWDVSQSPAVLKVMHTKTKSFLIL